MLESMTRNRQPTRAEATDVANAILDGTDCVMLSAESASGAYPVESISTLARIAIATEPNRSRFELWERMKTLPQAFQPDLHDLTSIAAEAIIEFGKSAVVVVPTETGWTVRSIARFRLPVWIAGVASSEHVTRHLHFSYGVHRFPSPGGSTIGTPSRASSWPHMVSREPWPCCCVAHRRIRHAPTMPWS